MVKSVNLFKMTKILILSRDLFIKILIQNFHQILKCNILKNLL